MEKTMNKNFEISFHNYEILESIRYRIELLTILADVISDSFLRKKISAEQLEIFSSAFNGDTKLCLADLQTLMSCIKDNVDMQI